MEIKSGTDDEDDGVGAIKTKWTNTTIARAISAEAILSAGIIEGVNGALNAQRLSTTDANRTCKTKVPCNDIPLMIH